MADDQSVASLVPLMASFGALETQRSGYYRSKLFSLHDELSPFVSAASPIFSLLDRFVVSESLPPLERVMVNLEHELRAFQSRLLSQSHTETENALAYFLLTSTIDEVLVRSYMRLYGRAPAFKAFTPPTYTKDENELSFFSILSLLKAKPYEHLPLLELAYYCLMAGFEGEQHGRPDGRQVLEAELDELYRLMIQFRQQRTFSLFEPSQSKPLPQKPYRRLCGIGGSMIAVLLGCFYLSQLILEHEATRLRFTSTFITTLDE